MFMTKIILKEESYKIMGAVFDVYNELGPGYQEKHYQKALEVKLRNSGINYESQKEIKLPFENDNLGKFYLDFLVGKSDKKIILEIKKSKYITLQDIRQIKRYLEATSISLGIIINFGRNDGVQYKRVVKVDSHKIRDKIRDKIRTNS